MKLQSDPTVIYAINRKTTLLKILKECFTNIFLPLYNTYAVKEFHQDQFA